LNADSSRQILEPVKRSRVYESIVEQIRALVREGSWRPGDQIPPEREMAERFRVSRTSVREALRALEMQGIIESKQGGARLSAARIRRRSSRRWQRPSWAGGGRWRRSWTFAS
jgi:DNA-binding FadR family transcriptional regulator